MPEPAELKGLLPGRGPCGRGAVRGACSGERACPAPPAPAGPVGSRGPSGPGRPGPGRTGAAPGRADAPGVGACRAAGATGAAGALGALGALGATGALGAPGADRAAGVGSVPGAGARGPGGAGGVAGPATGAGAGDGADPPGTEVNGGRGATVGPVGPVTGGSLTLGPEAPGRLAAGPVAVDAGRRPGADGPGADGPGADGPGADGEPPGALLPSPPAGDVPLVTGKASLSLRTTGGSTVEEADRTNSPSSLSLAITALLSTPSSFASSYTRTFATALLSRSGPVRARTAATSRGHSSLRAHRSLIALFDPLPVSVGVRFLARPCSSVLVSRDRFGARDILAGDPAPQDRGVQRPHVMQRPRKSPPALG